jgi:hypothetical protein
MTRIKFSLPADITPEKLVAEFIADLKRREGIFTRQSHHAAKKVDRLQSESCAEVMAVAAHFWSEVQFVAPAPAEDPV